MKKIMTMAIAGFVLVVLFAQEAYTQTRKTDDILGIWYNEEKTSKLQLYKDGNKYFAKMVCGILPCSDWSC
jgi:hypothetical protein